MTARICTGIPWAPERRLGEAYNYFMGRVEDWGLVLDWDVALVNVHWYDLCLAAIAANPDAGLITCLTNRIGCPLQKAPDAPASDNIEEHRSYAYLRQRDHDARVLDYTDQQRWWLSGFFYLIRRRVWDEIAPAPPEKFLGLDNWIHARIRERGHPILVMQGLYVYHRYGRDWKHEQGGGSA